MSDERMRALTIWQPWADAIAYGTKRVENRAWPAPLMVHDERIAIHAGKTVDLDSYPPVGESWAVPPWPLEELQTGVVLAVARVVGCHLGHRRCRDEDGYCSPWAGSGQYHWTLAEVRPLAEPIPCRGAQRLWRLPEDVEQAVLKQLAATVHGQEG